MENSLKDLGSQMQELGNSVKAGNKEGKKNDAQLDAMRHVGSYPRIEKKH